MIRVALIGCGNMGRNWLRVLRANPRFDIVAVVDPIAPDATHRHDWRGAPAFDAAVVATQTDRHWCLAHGLLYNGKHVLVEKPMAPTASECMGLLAIARDRLVVGHVERLNPAFVALQASIRSGAIGATSHVSMLRAGPRPDIVASKNNVSIDLAVHDIDLLSLLAGPLRLSARTVCEDDATFRFASLGGVTSDVRASWRAIKKERHIGVAGTAGLLQCDLIAQTVHWTANGSLTRVMDVAHAEPLALQAEAFADFVETGEPGRLATGLEAATAVALTET